MTEFADKLVSAHFTVHADGQEREFLPGRYGLLELSKWMVFGMRSELMEDLVVRDFKAHFGAAANGFVVKEGGGGDARAVLSLNVTLYNFCVIRLVVEKGASFASLLTAESNLHLVSMNVSGNGFGDLAAAVDDEVRLRIPDKYLVAKGWG